MKMHPSVLVAASALVLGFLLGRGLRPSAPPTVAPPSERLARRAAARPDADVQDRLRARVQALERALARARAPAAPAPAHPAPATHPPPARARDERRGPPAPEEMRAHLEEIRASDPARYARMTNHVANLRTRQLARAQGKLDILASVDAARLTPGQRRVHEQYQDLIARQEELRALAFAPMEDAAVSDAQRAAAQTEMREVGRQLRDLAHQERETLLDQAARAFGVTGDAAQDLVETVKAVYQATEAWGGPGAPGGRRPPPR